eukprot:SAG31_NODE_45859_length_257_cov_0.645570_1_plen_24_part_10
MVALVAAPALASLVALPDAAKLPP